MTVFGGESYQAGSAILYNDVWVLSNANGVGGTPTWTQMTPSGAAPSPRAAFATAGDPASNRMFVFGGDNGSGYFNEAWVLSGANGLGSLAWTLLSPSGTLPSGRDQSNAVYDQASNGILIFGGDEQQPSVADYSDVWALTLTTNTTIPGVPVAEGVGATWIQVFSPFSGDANGDSYTTYEYATSSGGPWTMACGNGIPGDPAWRRCAIYGLTPATPYYVRVTFYDPDGVTGSAAQVIGPITTLAVSNDFVTIGQATAQVEDTNILVTIPVADDANTNSGGTVSVATNSNGPWTPRCGSLANMGPKQCRVHGLTKGTNYYFQVNITDPDGVVGTTPQVIGPIHYTGLTDLALNKPVTADPGWGCCSDPAQLTDGVIEASDWMNGFAWTGGTGHWGGGVPGIKQATVDLQTAQTVGRVDWWPHDPNSVPATWFISVSNDGSNFAQVFANSDLTCRTATLELDVFWSFPSCSLSAEFPTVTARYVQISFDDTTLFDGLHGWASEIEVLGSTDNAPATPAVTVIPSSQGVSVAQDLSVAISVSGSDGTPSGLVTLTGGSYISGPTPLSNGGASIIIPAGSLPVGKDTLTASYSPDSNSSSTYNGATGTASVTVSQASLTSPAPGSTLLGPNVTFTWTAATGATSYQLWLGSTGIGSYNLDYSSGLTATSVTVAHLPSNGATVYARLITVINGVQVHSDYTYTAATQSALTTPTPGSTLTGPDMTFGWTVAAGASSYQLWLGSTGAGSYNLYYSGPLTGTSATVAHIPTNGGTVYARLITNYSGVQVSADYIYTATNTALIAPASGSTLAGPDVTFTWLPATGATGYQLWLGSTGAGSDNVFYENQQTTNSVAVVHIPTNGSTIYARLITHFNAVLIIQDYTYTAATQATLTTPPPSSTLAGPTVTFSWTPGTGATNYQLWLGSTGVGSDNLYYSGPQTVTSLAVAHIPTNGATIYARLITNYNGVQEHYDYTYTAATQSSLTTPTPGSTLAGSSVTFDWTVAAGATSNQLWLGSTGVGSYNLYYSGTLTGTSAAVNHLPTNGTKIYARLITNYSGVQVSTDYTYTAQ